MPHMPFVSILTPVFNGAKYLDECISSVMKQDYRNFEYIIVNNRSTDATHEIAARRADGDPRIRVVDSKDFVGVIENHNRAFRMISPSSAYCKVVSADDWITPDYLTKMVAFAESHPSVGIIGCYQRSAEKVKWQKLPADVEIVSGREICRRGLLEGGEVFGTPTSLLYRSAMVRRSENFYPHSLDYADTSACYKNLLDCDFGFVHEVLSFERIHEYQISEEVRTMGKGTVAFIQILLEFGPVYLRADELELRLAEVLERHFKWLGGCVLKLKTLDFWEYQSSSMKDLAYPIRWAKVMKYAMLEMIEESRHPALAIRKLWKALKRE